MIGENQNKPTQTIPFERHAGTPLPAIPVSCLSWLLQEAKLSRSLGEGVRMELARRGIAPRPHRGLVPADRGAAGDTMTYGNTLIILASLGPWRG
jgi:hypothetical protein